MKYLYIAIISTVLLLVACGKQGEQLELALKAAGDNREELQKVLNRYKCDNEKYKAACFLIENMVFYGSYEGEALELYRSYFVEFSKFPSYRHAKELVDSLEKADGPFSREQLAFKADAKNVDSTFLVNHIEWAFKVWREQPWGKNVCFSDFCEYILPYRIGDEPLSLWREELYEKYNHILNDFRKSSDAQNPIKAAKILMDTLRKENYRFTSLFPDGPHLGPMVLQWRTGSCREFADAIIYAFRALGIPCGTDRVIQRGDTNASHFWNFILDKNGNTYMAEFPYQEKWLKANEYKVIKGKVYRVTYSLNEELAKKKYEYSNFHPVFCRPFFYDVTDIYTAERNRMLTIPVDSLYHTPNNKELVYLCLANRQQWIPVAYSQLIDEKLCFDNIEGGIACILATWDGKQLSMLSDPFVVSSDTGEIHFLNPQKCAHDVNLYRKFYMAVKGYFYSRMIGGVIEGSNRADFNNSDTLFLVKEAPYRLYTVAHLKSDKAYRYIRYRGAKDSYCNIAELSFYENRYDTLPLYGKIIGTPGCYGNDGRREYTNVFDGKTDTSFDFKEPDTGWAGLDMEKPCKVSKAIYTPRNDLNFVYKGEVYELFYWGKGKWNSLGKKKAIADSIVYTAPKNALLYLKNHSSGKDERIFDYWNGKQRFW